MVRNFLFCSSELTIGLTRLARPHFALRLPPDRQLPYLRQAIGHFDPHISLRVADRWLQLLPLRESLSTMVMFRRSSIAQLRTRALTYSVDHGVVGAVRAAVVSLFDRNGSVRETAQFLLTRQGRIVPRTCYLQRIKTALTGATLLTAWRGLLARGVAEDLPLFFSLLNDSRARLREIAAAGVDRWGSTDDVATSLLPLLQDPQERVARAVCCHLRRRLSREAYAWIPQLIAAAATAQTSRRLCLIVSLLKRLAYEDALQALLSLATQRDQDREIVLRALRSLSARSVPPASLQTLLTTLLQDQEP